MGAPNHAVRPSHLNHYALAVFEIGEVDDRLLKCLEPVHGSSIRDFRRYVKYIVAQICTSRILSGLHAP